MPWSQKVIRQFQLIPPNPTEKEFYGAYNKLLYSLFPADTDFTVVPQYMPAPNGGAADFIVMFEVQLQNVTVFVLEVKPPSSLDLISTRQEADGQMRQRLGDLAYGGHCPLPILHGVSAMGRQLCFYTLVTGNQDADITPPAIPRHATRITDTAPAARWNYDILDATGEAKLRAVVDEIKQGCAVL
ncbi:hypothetical protein PQX77_006889 [Marasmius sp. AFHP31]|nr:hypothetical protein PQX77_006889 [Marasmius sp. AFHP31]